MKKINSLYLIIVVLFCLLVTNCRTSFVKTPIECESETINDRMIDSLKFIFTNNINNYNLSIEELNSMLSEVSKKKIITTDWRSKYKNNGMGDDDYINYRLAILYGLKLEDIAHGDEDFRLFFFLAAVCISDYEILDLLNFQDSALNWDSCYGETVLTTAVRQRNVKMVKYLLDRGIDKNKREFPACYDDAEEGQNAYEIALEIGDQEIIDLLK